MDLDRETDSRLQHNIANTSQPIRFSARVRAAKEKEQQKPIQQNTSEPTSTKGKARANQDKRPRRSAPALLTISEPICDPKGKKRAAPVDSDTEEPPAKRQKTRNNRGKSSRKSNRKKDMSTTANPEPSPSTSQPGTSNIVPEEDVIMGEPVQSEGDDAPEGEAIVEDSDQSDEEAEEDPPNAPGSGNSSNDTPLNPVAPPAETSFGGSILSSDFNYGSYMGSIGSRLKTILNNIKPKSDPTTRLLSLQELSELLSMSNEDSLSGYFSADAYVKELVHIMGGPRKNDDDDGNDGEGDSDMPQDEDAALAAALAISGGGYMGEENLEEQLLACRCLANLIEAMPGSAYTLVHNGAVPVLCSKLLAIQFIDLAEQTISTLEKLSEEYQSPIVREGGLSALLNYLDFFSTHVQRTALQAAANCCRNLAVENFNHVRDVFPMIRNVLEYSDQRLVEYSCMCVIRIIESYYRSNTEPLETLIDVPLMRAVNNLLLPPSGTPIINATTATSFLRALSSAARASPKISLTLLEAGVADTLYAFLTGVLPSVSEANEDQGNAPGGQGLGGGLADMAVMQNLAHRPKDQVEEALGLISELTPPLPRDGVFDPKGYTEKTVSRALKQKVKEAKAIVQAIQAATESGPPTLPAPAPTEQDVPISTVVITEEPPTPVKVEDTDVPIVPAPQSGTEGEPSSSSRTRKDSSHPRLSLLRDNLEVVSRFLHLIIPVLFDVYAASMTLQIRLRSLTSILKATNFVDDEDISLLFRNVPVASFIGSILSSRDHPALVTGALQLVELLLVKSPNVYKASLRKEGVLHEVSRIAVMELKVTLKPPPSPAEPSSSTTENGDSVPPPKVKTSSIPSDPQDAYIIRSRLIKIKYLTSTTEGAGDASFDALKGQIITLEKGNATEDELRQTLQEVAGKFSNIETGISSFELLKSGFVEGLLAFSTNEGSGGMDIEKREELILEAFSVRSGYATPGSQTPMANLVKRLQESLTRMESYEVISASPGSMDDAKRSSLNLIGRTVRLKLVAEDTIDIPKACQSFVATIHAIAPFSALEDYLKPRIAGIILRPDQLTPGLLQALIGYGVPSSALAQSILARLGGRPPTNGGSSSNPPGSLGSLLSALSGIAASTGTSGSMPNPSGGQAGDSSSASAPPPSTSENSGLVRRRSMRLRGQPPAGDARSSNANTSGASGAADSSTAGTDPPPGSAFIHVEDRASSALAGAFIQQLVEDIVDPDDPIDNEGASDDEGGADRTVTLSFDSITPVGGAQTPVIAPGGSAPIPIARASGSGAGSAVPTPTPSPPKPSKLSYASAAQGAVNKATDFYLEFRIDDHILPPEMTIYGALHRFVASRTTDGQLSPSAIWNGNHTIKYRKIPGKRPPPTPKEESAMETDQIAGHSADEQSSKILRLLKVLYRLNAEGIGRLESGRMLVALPDSAFVNNKLTAKLTRQLEEIMILASNCLPDWALDLPQSFGFLFPFSTRYLFMQSTSFGHARLLQRVLATTTRDTNNRRDGLDQYGRPQRKKIEVPRSRPLEVALKMFDLYGKSSAILDVHFQGEAGTGLGPTMEFYASVCRDFARRDLRLWRDADSTLTGKYVFHPFGLFPAPMLGSLDDDENKRRTALYKLLGQFIARSLLDSRVIDISLNKLFLKSVLEEVVPLSVSSVKGVDSALGKSLSTLSRFVNAKQNIESDDTLNEQEKGSALQDLQLDGVRLEDLCLDFTVPGFEDMELKPDGRNIPVNTSNVGEYVKLVVDAIVGTGLQPSVRAFKEGFSTMFPVSDLKAFSLEELVMMFGNADEDWGIETLNEAIKADHGFNVESKAIRDLIEIMTAYDPTGRRDFLQFITGSPKLPIGGFRALQPMLTVVRKPHEPPLTSDDYLPSVMTCAHYLKLPDYSSKDVMTEKLRIAMREGAGSFFLS